MTKDQAKSKAREEMNKLDEFYYWAEKTELGWQVKKTYRNWKLISYKIKGIEQLN